MGTRGESTISAPIVRCAFLIAFAAKYTRGVHSEHREAVLEYTGMVQIRHSTQAKVDGRIRWTKKKIR